MYLLSTLRYISLACHFLARYCLQDALNELSVMIPLLFINVSLSLSDILFSTTKEATNILWVYICRSFVGVFNPPPLQVWVVDMAILYEV